MHGLRFQLPPPNALVAFEAAARHLSFTLAAGELNVTRVAVSRQVKALETHIGVALFRRMHKSLSLTPEGTEYFDVVSKALTDIARNTTSLRSRKPTNRVTVTTTVGFSSYWLMPRIGSFRKRFPDIDIRVLVSDVPIDMEREGVDIAIRYGGGSWPDCRATFLLQEEIFPTCSQSYFQGRQKLENPEALLRETLLHLEGPYDQEVTWHWWFKAHGIEDQRNRTGLAVNSYTHLVQAVLEGQGIALVGPPLLSPYYRKDVLIRPITVAPVKRKAFYIVLPSSPTSSTATTAFCDWIVEESSQQEAAGSNR